MLTGGLKFLQATSEAGYIPPAKIPAIDKAVLARCDARDGVSDGVLNDPRQCHFDPSALLCKGANADTCLTAPQVDSLKKIYDGAHEASRKQKFTSPLPCPAAG